MPEGCNFCSFLNKKEEDIYYIPQSPQECLPAHQLPEDLSAMMDTGSLEGERPVTRHSSEKYTFRLEQEI